MDIRLGREKNRDSKRVKSISSKYRKVLRPHSMLWTTQGDYITSYSSDSRMLALASGLCGHTIKKIPVTDLDRLIRTGEESRGKPKGNMFVLLNYQYGYVIVF